MLYTEHRAGPAKHAACDMGPAQGTHCMQSPVGPALHADFARSRWVWLYAKCKENICLWNQPIGIRDQNNPYVRELILERDCSIMDWKMMVHWNLRALFLPRIIDLSTWNYMINLSLRVSPDIGIASVPFMCASYQWRDAFQGRSWTVTCTHWWWIFSLYLETAGK